MRDIPPLPQEKGVTPELMRDIPPFSTRERSNSGINERHSLSLIARKE